MAIIKASLGFKKENTSENVKFGGNVITSLNADAESEEPVFPDLPISIKDLEALNASLDIANQALVNGGRKARENAGAAKLGWDVAMTSTANYVSTIANGDAQVISLGGFIPTKGKREKHPIPEASGSFNSTINGVKGAILAGSKKKVPRAIAHVVTALPPGATMSYIKDTAIITIGEQKIYIGAYTGKGTELYSLNSGTPYNVSMFSVNASGHGPATQPKEVIPQ